jgi:uncharacterized RDD family membrane protein YckC
LQFPAAPFLNYQDFLTNFPHNSLQILMSTLKVPTSFNIDVEFEIPEFFRRFLSLLIDLVIQFLYLVLASKILSLIFTNLEKSKDFDYDRLAYIFLMYLPIFLYHVSLEITLNGQSFGKKIMQLRVVNENGGRASVSQFLIRWLLRVSDTWIVLAIVVLMEGAAMGGNNEGSFIVLGILLFLITDIILVISSPKGQRIGDILARTILIRTHTKSSITETVFQEVENTYTPQFPQIMRLSDKDINAIKSILESARRRNDDAVADTAAEKIKRHLGIETQMPPSEFLEILLKDYNYLSTN